MFLHFPRRTRHTDWHGLLGLTLVLWLCSLAALAGFASPLWGIKTTLTLAIVLLPMVLAICWGICVKNGAEAHDPRIHGH